VYGILIPRDFFHSSIANESRVSELLTIAIKDIDSDIRSQFDRQLAEARYADERGFEVPQSYRIDSLRIGSAKYDRLGITFSLSAVITGKRSRSLSAPDEAEHSTYVSYHAFLPASLPLARVEGASGVQMWWNEIYVEEYSVDGESPEGLLFPSDVFGIDAWTSCDIECGSKVWIDRNTESTYELDAARPEAFGSAPRGIVLNDSTYQNLLSLAEAGHGRAGPSWDTFWRMFYFSTATITTLGYGDIVPVTTTARMLTSSEAILGIILIGLFVNRVSSRQGSVTPSRSRPR
jgi:hypothetical protein